MLVADESFVDWILARQLELIPLLEALEANALDGHLLYQVLNQSSWS